MDGCFFMGVVDSGTCGKVLAWLGKLLKKVNTGLWFSWKRENAVITRKHATRTWQMALNVVYL